MLLGVGLVRAERVSSCLKLSEERFCEHDTNDGNEPSIFFRAPNRSKGFQPVQDVQSRTLSDDASAGKIGMEGSVGETAENSAIPMNTSDLELVEETEKVEDKTNSETGSISSINVRAFKMLELLRRTAKGQESSNGDSIQSLISVRILICSFSYPVAQKLKLMLTKFS